MKDPVAVELPLTVMVLFAGLIAVMTGFVRPLMPFTISPTAYGAVERTLMTLLPFTCCAVTELTARPRPPIPAAPEAVAMAEPGAR